MKNAILLHGLADKEEYFDETIPSGSNAHWFPWLQKQLMIKGIKADTPEVPVPFEMSWESWVREVERFEINEDTTLIGHSMGGGFWVRYISEHPELKVHKVILVAPWLDLDRKSDGNFFNFELNAAITSQANEFVIFASDNDMESVQKTTDYLRSSLPDAKFVGFHEYGHFCYRDLKTDAFPEILAEVCS